MKTEERKSSLMNHDFHAYLTELNRVRASEKLLLDKALKELEISQSELQKTNIELVLSKQRNQLLFNEYQKWLECANALDKQSDKENTPAATVMCTQGHDYMSEIVPFDFDSFKMKLFKDQQTLKSMNIEIDFLRQKVKELDAESLHVTENQTKNGIKSELTGDMDEWKLKYLKLENDRDKILKQLSSSKMELEYCQCKLETFAKEKDRLRKTEEELEFCKKQLVALKEQKQNQEYFLLLESNKSEMLSLRSDLDASNQALQEAVMKIRVEQELWRETFQELEKCKLELNTLRLLKEGATEGQVEVEVVPPSDEFMELREEKQRWLETRLEFDGCRSKFQEEKRQWEQERLELCSAVQRMKEAEEKWVTVNKELVICQVELRDLRAEKGLWRETYLELGICRQELSKVTCELADRRNSDVSRKGTEQMSDAGLLNLLETTRNELAAVQTERDSCLAELQRSRSEAEREAPVKLNELAKALELSQQVFTALHKQWADSNHKIEMLEKEILDLHGERELWSSSRQELQDCRSRLELCQAEIDRLKREEEQRARMLWEACQFDLQEFPSEITDVSQGGVAPSDLVRAGPGGDMLCSAEETASRPSQQLCSDLQLDPIVPLPPEPRQESWEVALKDMAVMEMSEELEVCKLQLETLRWQLESSQGSADKALRKSHETMQQELDDCRAEVVELKAKLDGCMADLRRQERSEAALSDELDYCRRELMSRATRDLSAASSTSEASRCELAERMAKSVDEVNDCWADSFCYRSLMAHLKLTCADLDNCRVEIQGLRAERDSWKVVSEEADAQRLELLTERRSLESTLVDVCAVDLPQPEELVPQLLSARGQVTCLLAESKRNLAAKNDLRAQVSRLQAEAKVLSDQEQRRADSPNFSSRSEASFHLWGKMIDAQFQEYSDQTADEIGNLRQRIETIRFDFKENLRLLDIRYRSSLDETRSSLERLKVFMTNWLCEKETEPGRKQELSQALLDEFACEGPAPLGDDVLLHALSIYEKRESDTILDLRQKLSLCEALRVEVSVLRNEKESWLDTVRELGECRAEVAAMHQKLEDVTNELRACLAQNAALKSRVDDNQKQGPNQEDLSCLSETFAMSQCREALMDEQKRSRKLIEQLEECRAEIEVLRDKQMNWYEASTELEQCHKELAAKQRTIEEYKLDLAESLILLENVHSH